MPIPTPHIEAKKEEIAGTVIMPGDPLRARYVAEHFLENAKLVNKDNVAKKVSVKLDAYKKVASAEVVMLTADKDLAGVANVNTKEKEYVVPVKYQTAVNNQTAEILLPANSVAVVVF